MRKNKIFESNRYFTIFDIVVSHGQLLIRSQKNENQNNIDIIFFDTTYIQIFSKLNGICIRKIINSNDFDTYKTVRKYLNYETSNLFEIESNEETYYITASFVRIFENQLDFTESSLDKKENERGSEITIDIF